MKNNTSDYVVMMELLTQHFATFAIKGAWSEEDKMEWQSYRRFVSDAERHLRSIKPPRAVKQERGYQHILDATEKRVKGKETKLVKDAANFALKQSEKSRYGNLLDRYLN